MPNTIKLELSIPELAKLNELTEQLLAKFGTPEAAQQAVANAVAQASANPTPAAPSAPASARTAPQMQVPFVAPQTAQPTANPAPDIPFTAPAQAPNAPQPPAAAQSAYSSMPPQGYPSNPPASAQPTYPAPIPAPAPVPQQPPVTTGITYTVEQIARAAAPIMQRGDGQKLAELLGKYGVQALTQLPPQYLPSFAADIRALGAQI